MSTPTPPQKTPNERDADAARTAAAPEAEADAKRESRPMRLSGWMAAVMDQLADDDVARG